MPQAQRGFEIVVSFWELVSFLQLTDEEGIWDPSDCSMLERESLFVVEAQLVG